MTSVQPRYRPDIDGLRGVAIASVIGFHAFPSLLPGGFVGVDVFFVISGYLISGIILGNLAKDTFSFADFYARRVRRIVPALLLVLGVSYAIGWARLYPDEFRQLCKHMAAGAGFISNLALRKEGGYFDDIAGIKPMLHLWSLGVEEQFYIVWPLLLWLGRRCRIHPAGFILVILVLSFGWNVAVVSTDQPATFFSPLVRAWELAAGALLAYAALHGRIAFRPTVSEALAAAGLLLILIALVWLRHGVPFPGWRALLPVAGSWLLIAAGPQTWTNRVLLGNRLMVGLGLISYALYLWHWPLLSFAAILLENGNSLAVRIAAVAVATGLAWLTYRFVETPIRFGRWRDRSVPALASALVAIGVLSLVSYQRDGLPGRFPPSTDALATFHYDPRPTYRSGSCFLETLDQDRFGDCVDPPRGDGSPLVLLWGDSHAAHLYPGLKTRPVRIAEFTAGGCPPILGIDVSFRPNCRAINDEVIKRAATFAPQIAVLAANWGAADWHYLATTFAELRRIGVTRIVVVGPFPGWRQPLPKLLLRYRERFGGDVPERVPNDLAAQVAGMDQAMRAFVEASNATYVSPLRLLCDERGCLTRVGPLPDHILAFDTSHLTTLGSEYVVRALALP